MIQASSFQPQPQRSICGAMRRELMPVADWIWPSCCQIESPRSEQQSAVTPDRAPFLLGLDDEGEARQLIPRQIVMELAHAVRVLYFRHPD